MTDKEKQALEAAARRVDLARESYIEAVQKGIGMDEAAMDLTRRTREYNEARRIIEKR